MRRSGYLVSVAVLVAAVLGLAAEGVSAAEWIEGTVRLSTGEELKGKIHFIGDHLLIHNEAQKREYTVRTNQIKRFQTIIEKRTMAKKWFFREDGRDVKVDTGQRYPVLHYITRVVFHDGTKLEGHIKGKTIYVTTEDKKRYKFALRRQDEGQVGEKFEDLVYVKEIVFAGGDAAGVKGTIEGTIVTPPAEKLKKVLAINRQHNLVLEGKLRDGGCRFKFTDCTTGTYDLVAVTDKALYLYLSREKEEDCGRFDTKQVADLQALVDKLRDFFHKQDVLYAAGNTKRAFVLIRKERYGGTTLAGAEHIRRYEVWVMEKPKEMWMITKRLYLSRQNFPVKKPPREKMVILPPMGGHIVGPDSKNLVLKLELTPTSLKPIPPPRKEEVEGHAG